MEEFTGFIEVIRELIALFENMIPVEQEKLDAAIKNRVSFVEECMHKEQAFILQLKGLEQKREAAQRRLNMENNTFRQILEKAPEDVATVLRPLFDQLSSQVQMFRSISDNARDIIEVNLHAIQSAIVSDSAAKTTYSATGKKKDDPDGKHFTSRSV
ncbi:MAG: flagellar protein FlgN [Coprococcus sp.]|nr:flagellar protein FlgN [Coprococcus sp.]